jgi:hypothetical protein
MEVGRTENYGVGWEDGEVGMKFLSLESAVVDSRKGKETYIEEV